MNDINTNLWDEDEISVKSDILSLKPPRIPKNFEEDIHILSQLGPYLFSQGIHLVSLLEEFQHWFKKIIKQGTDIITVRRQYLDWSSSVATVLSQLARFMLPHADLETRRFLAHEILDVNDLPLRDRIRTWFLFRKFNIIELLRIIHWPSRKC